MGGEMPGSNKFIPYGGPDPGPPQNLWEILERGSVDTYPLHTALWLFKNAQGGPGPFRHLPGPTFGYRLRDREARSKGIDHCVHTLQALSWLLCLPAFGVGHLQAGPTAQVYGSLSEGLPDPPAKVPVHCDELPAEIRDLLVQATFPLSELPALTSRQVEYYCTMKYFKYSWIFGILESQLLRKAYSATRDKIVPDNIERDLQYAIDRVCRAFDMPTREDWEYDRKRNVSYIKGVRCRRLVQISGRRTKDASTQARCDIQEETSPYSPPYWGLPIFDVKPLYAEALRLVKSVPDNVQRCPEFYFMTPEDWRHLHGIRRARMSPKGQCAAGDCPKNADYRAAWDWVESFYGLRVRVALHPSDKNHKGRSSSPLQELH